MLLVLISTGSCDCSLECIVMVAETDKCWPAELQSRAAQALLSRLAALPHVSLLASFDHVDTPVLWDSFTAARFNWRLYDATTFQPQLENQVQAGFAPAVTVARSVFRSDTASLCKGPCFLGLPCKFQSRICCDAVLVLSSLQAMQTLF